MSCGRDCDALASADERSQLARMMQQPLALLGWSGCPCTNIARARFESIGACYVQTVWPTDDAPLYKYLQCVHGQVHHSFVFVGGSFVGDGFALEEERLARPQLQRCARPRRGSPASARATRTSPAGRYSRARSRTTAPPRDGLEPAAATGTRATAATTRSASR